MIFQSNFHFVVGHGPGKCGAVGCVLCSCVMALVEFGVTVTPEEFNANALADNAFPDVDGDGHGDDSLDVAGAMNRYDVDVTARFTQAMQYELSTIFGKRGRALVRVGFAPGRSDHTILAIGADTKTGEILCLDPAIGHVRLSVRLTAVGLGWGHDASGKPITKDYYTANVRGLLKR